MSYIVNQHHACFEVDPTVPLNESQLRGCTPLPNEMVMYQHAGVSNAGEFAREETLLLIDMGENGEAVAKSVDGPMIIEGSVEGFISDYQPY